MFVGYGRCITSKLWEAVRHAGLDLSGIPATSQPSEERQTSEAKGISTNLIDLWAVDAGMGVPVMEMFAL